jgi:hypothetical protein
MTDTEYKWRVVIYPDYSYQHDCDHDNEDDAAECARLVEVHGAWGFNTEKWVDATEPCASCGHATPGHWENVDSCWGFVEAEQGMPYMMSVATHEIPTGATYAVCSGFTDSRKVTVDEICTKEENDNE